MNSLVGHGGADEGFRARLVAWKDHANALVVMVSSDTGSIINEVVLAITKACRWPGFEPTLKKVVSLDPANGKAIEGDWEIEQAGTATFAFEDGHLVITGSF